MLPVLLLQLFHRGKGVWCVLGDLLCMCVRVGEGAFLLIRDP